MPNPSPNDFKRYNELPPEFQLEIDRLYGEKGLEGTTSFYNYAEGLLQPISQELITGMEVPPAITTREIPGLKPLTDTASIQDELKALERVKREQTSQIPALRKSLDEQQTENYIAAMERYVREGYPDERQLEGKILNDYLIQENLAELPPQDPSGIPDPVTLKYLQYRADKIPSVTAQSKARDQIFGIGTTARQPMEAPLYTEIPTPVQPGTIQQRIYQGERPEDIIAPMSTLELTKQVLAPQAIGVSGERNRLDIQQNALNAIEDIQKNEQLTQYEAQLAYFNSYKDMMSPYLLRSGVALDDLDNELNKLTQKHIKEVYGYSLDRPESQFAETPTEKELLPSFPLKEKPEGMGATDTLLFGLEALTTTKYDPVARQRMADMGIISDPDVITETMTMAILRDLNLPFRAVINPTMSGLENLGIIERTKPGEEIETILPAARVELENKGGYFDVLEQADNYLREILVETATMRSLGNDIAQVKYIGPFELPSDPSKGRDILVGVGTLAEMFIPITAPGEITKAVGTGVSKLPRVGSKALGKTFEVGLDLLAGNGALYPLIKYGAQGADVATRGLPTITLLSKEAKAVQGLQDGDVLAAALERPALKDYFINDRASVLGKTADTVADNYLALSARAGGATDDILQTLAQEGRISWRMADAVQRLSPEQAVKVLQAGSTSNTKVISEVSSVALANRQLASRTTIAGTTQDIIELTNRLRNSALEGLASSNLKDYVRLTDKTIVSKKWLEQNLDEINNMFVEDGKNVLIRNTTKDPVTGKVSYEIDEAKVRTILNGSGAGSDAVERMLTKPVYEVLLSKGALDVGELNILQSAILDDIAPYLSKSAFKPYSGKLLEQISDPSLFTRITTDEGFFNNVFSAVRISQEYNAASKFKRASPAAEALVTNAQNNAGISRFTAEVTEASQRVERNLRGAFGNVNRLNRSAGVDIGLNSGAKTMQNYSSVLDLQIRGLTLDEIASLDKLPPQTQYTASKASRGPNVLEAIVEDVVRYYFNDTNDIIKNYLSSARGVNFRSVIAGSRSTDEAIGKLIRHIEEAVPEAIVRKKKISLEDAMLVQIVKLENEAIVSDALKKLLLTENFALSTDVSVAKNIQASFDIAMARYASPEFVPQLDSAKYETLINKLMTEYIANGDLPYQMDAFKCRSILEQFFDVKNIIKRSKGILSPDEDISVMNRIIAELVPDEVKNLLANNGIDMSDFDLFIYEGNDLLSQVLPGLTMESLALETLIGGRTYQIQEYVTVTAGKFGISPSDLSRKYNYSLQQIFYPSRIKGSTQGILYANNIEKTIIENFSRGHVEGVVQDTIAQLQKNSPGTAEWLGDQLGYYANGMRKNMISGQLGGKYLPNLPYQAENFLTAPIIAAVTNPNYLLTVLKQQFKDLIGVTPYRQLRYMANADPTAVLPGTRYTYGQIYREFARRNLGVSNAGINIGDDMAAEINSLARGWKRFTAGVPGARAGGKDAIDVVDFGMELAKTTPSFGRRIAGDIAGGVAELRQPFASRSASPFMVWADETDRSFREAIFMAALQKGEGFDEAARLARTVMLDYGKMPQWAKKGVGKMILYFSFTYASTLAVMEAMLKNPTRIAGMINYHRNLSRAAGTWFFAGDQGSQYLWLNTTEDPSVANTYLRSPYMGSLVSVFDTIGYATAYSTGRGRDMGQRSIEGLSEYFYIPMLDFYTELDAEGKKAVPAKEVFQIGKGDYLYKNLLNPGFLMNELFGAGYSTPYIFDRYDIEVVPPQLRRPGSPTFGGQQYRFRSKEGRNQYLWDALVIAGMGTQRTYNDYYNALAQAGFVEIPPGYDLGYFGENYAQPGLYDTSKAIDYLIYKERPLRIPQKYEVEWTKLKQQERRLMDEYKKYSK